MKCGIYEIDITPALGMEMPGYFSVRNATGIKEKLYCEAVCFENDGTKAVILSNDIIQIYAEDADEVRARISEQLGIDGANIFVCCTHTHTGGPVETWGDYVHYNPEYMAFVKNKLVDAAKMASLRLHDVTLSYASCTEDKLAYYRNYINDDGEKRTWVSDGFRPFGEVDKQVGVLRIDNTDGTPYGVIVNFACHCDCVGGTEFSSDYPGEMRKVLRTVYGDAFMPVFVNGFCGNINHCDPNGFHTEVSPHYKRMGRMLAADALRTRELAVKKFEDNTVAGALEYMKIPARIPEAEQVKWANETLAENKLDHTQLFYAREILKFEERAGEPFVCPVQVLKIGEIAFYGMPGEIYVEFGKMLKERSPFKYNMPANLANGCVGYVPIRELFAPNIYESKIGMSNKIIPDGGYMMVDRLIELANTL